MLVSLKLSFKSIIESCIGNINVYMTIFVKILKLPDYLENLYIDT